MKLITNNCNRGSSAAVFSTITGGGGIKALTMTMTPRNFPMVMVKMTNFDHLTAVILKFWLLSWSK